MQKLADVPTNTKYVVRWSIGWSGKRQSTEYSRADMRWLVGYIKRLWGKRTRITVNGKVVNP